LYDRNGSEVHIGDLVKVLSLDPADFSHLDSEALSEVMTMVGNVLEVYEIDQYGQACVTKEWWLGEGDVMSHSVGLSSHEFELADNDNS